MISRDHAALEAWLYGFVQPDGPRGEAARSASAALLGRLGDPQDRVRAVHIVGTAGKGTVARLVAGSLRSTGATVGLHQSPHVHDLRERFMVGDELPDWDDVAEAIAEVRTHTDALLDVSKPPTFFAVTAAIALVLARRAETDWLVIEAGIGGRHDATNVFTRDDVLSVVTAVGLDHTDILGPTPAAIAAEKAAVFAGRRLAILGPQPDADVPTVVRLAAVEHDTRLVEVEPTGDWRSDAEATAAAVVAELDPTAPAPVFAPHAGRYEVHEVDGRRWIFDGAHNPMKLAALAGSLRAEPGPRVGIIAVGEGKDLDASVAAIAGELDAAVVIEFGPPPGRGGPRSHPSTVVADALRAAGVADVQVATVAEGAVAAALERNEPATVVVTGSFLHLTDVRRVLLGR